MVWVPILFSVSLIGLIIASYTDLKERIVSNKLSYPLIVLGLVIHAAYAFFENNPTIFIYSAVSAAWGFGFAYLLWKMGVWAGGDVKLFAGIAALNPINPFILASFGLAPFVAETVQLPIFPMTLFIFSIFAMVPYGILIAVHGLVKRKEVRKGLAKALKEKAVQTVQAAVAVAGFGWLMQAIGVTTWLLIPVLFVLGLVKKREARLAIISGVFLASMYYGVEEAVVSAALLYVLFYGIYLFMKLYFVSKEVLRETKKVSDLEEGDIVADTIIEKAGTVKVVPGLEIKTIINYLISNRLQELQEYIKPGGRAIASSRRARGLIEEEIQELKALAAKKKIPSSLTVKLSSPFVPAMLIAYLAANIVGDIIWAVFL